MQPVYPPGNAPPPGAPPGYDHSSGQTGGSGYPEKGSYGTNPFNQGGHQAASNVTEDERLARQLQQEENARSAPNYGQQQHAPVYGQQQQGT